METAGNFYEQVTEKYQANKQKLLEYCGDDTVYDLSYLAKANRARKIDGDDKAHEIIELLIDYIMRNRPLTW